MRLFEIKPLLQDMGRNKAKLDKFSFSYARTGRDRSSAERGRTGQLLQSVHRGYVRQYAPR